MGCIQEFHTLPILPLYGFIDLTDENLIIRDAFTHIIGQGSGTPFEMIKPVIFIR